MLFCHCCFIYGRFPPKMPLFTPGSDTHTHRYIDLSKREKKFILWFLRPYCSAGGSICGRDHMWKPLEVILKQLWELPRRVSYVGHLSRMSCSDYIPPHRTKGAETPLWQLYFQFEWILCSLVSSLKTWADTCIVGVLMSLTSLPHHRQPPPPLPQVNF